MGLAPYLHCYCQHPDNQTELSRYIDKVNYEEKEHVVYFTHTSFSVYKTA